jgi:CubicO group peptidase (beta-lactamase class C family)
VTRVSGKPFAQFCKEQIFQPLGMTSTQWRDDFRRIVKNRAIAYEQRGGTTRQLMPFEDVHGNGGLLTTVGDLLKWNANFATAKVGGKDVVAQQQIQSKLNDGRTISYALGLFVEGDEIAHSGTTAAYNAWLGRYPKQGISVAVLCNSSAANGTQLARSVANVYLGKPAQVRTGVGERPSPWQPSPEQLATFPGTYYNDEIETTLTVALENGGLVIHRRPADTIKLTPTGNEAFNLGGGATVRFLDNELSIHESRVWDLRFKRTNGR